LAQEAGTHFLVRTCADRLAGSGDTTISREMEREPIRGDHQVEIRDDQGRVSTAKVSLRFRRMTVHPPIGKHRHYSALSLTVIHAQEDGTPEGREPIRWKLLTNRPVEDPRPAHIKSPRFPGLKWPTGLIYCRFFPANLA